MDKCIWFIFLTLNLVSASSIFNDICATCVPAVNCPWLWTINYREQQIWLKIFQCRKSYDQGLPSIFPTTPNEVFVCCPNNIGFQNNPNEKNKYQNSESNRRASNYAHNPNNSQGSPNTISPGNINYNVPQANTIPNHNNNHENDVTKQQNSQSEGSGLPTQTQLSNDNLNPVVTSPNPYFLVEQGQNNSSENKAFEGQCQALTSFPPAPESECCGREASDDDRIASSQNTIPNLLSALNFSRSSRTARGVPGHTLKRSIDDKNEDDKVIITLGNRISGGSETELYQFPWTVLLITTFDFGTNVALYNCGGSLLSARYVLTAGHCLYERGGIVKSVKVNLAEYDKRTFPTDCKISMGKRKCIQNIEMEAEQVIHHPQYMDDSLTNDIALVRLRGNAPYTEYIRPICLPPFNINQREFSNLQLAVAGWGRNGLYTSDIKQFTIVNLVPQRECRRFYTELTARQLCAAGYSGEDTCSGDSGGPLMTLYRGKYYVVGVVSGKRADSPCGTSVPSLYTNVFPYLDWIKRSIRN